MNSEIFNEELKLIKDTNIKESTRIILDMLPDYFYEVPASSTGKYHPSFSLGDGGLVRHVKVATRIMYELFNDSALHNFNSHEQDLLLMSIMLHDGLKSGLKKSEYTLFDHPIIMSNFIKENKDKLKLDDKDIKFVCSCIETHMGPWTTDYKGNEVLKCPTTKYERFVHMCDYLASRKFLNVNFNKNDIVL